MSSIRLIRWFLLVTYMALFVNDPVCLLVAQSRETDGFDSLFNGVDLTGWQGAVDDYEVVDGAITCKPNRGGVLFTQDEYADFIVELEFKLSPGGNNGLAIRYPGTGRASVDAMCELQVLDDDADIYKELDPRQYHGSIYGMVAPKRDHLKPVGEWNFQRVTVVGSRIQVELNGTEIVNADVAGVTEFKDNQPHPGKDRTHGFFGLAGHNDPVQFRNIRIKRLERFQIAPFRCEVTIPLGHRCMGILPTKSTSIADPLIANGFVLLGQDKPVAIVAVDWCEIRNESYDAWRQTIADAAGTTRDRVLVSCLHQHDAPVIDAGAARLLAEVGLRGELYDEAFHARVLDRVAEAVRQAMQHPKPITHVGTSQTTVERIASSRRVQFPDGRIAFSRGSSSGGDPFLRDAPEGLIDPRLRTVSFWNHDQCLLELHSYATHPMSSYGRGEVSSDFVGLARQRRQSDHPEVHQVYVSGCSGDVTAGKYNDGSPASRQQLIERMYQAMVAASQHVAKKPIAKVDFRTTPLLIEFNPDESLNAEKLRSTLSDPAVAVEQRILAAMSLSSRQRVESGQAIDLPCIDLGPATIVLFPGESFVGYQLQAQQMLAKSMLLPIGYGECWTGYIPTAESFAEKFNESWQWVGPDAPDKMKAALQSLLMTSLPVK